MRREDFLLEIDGGHGVDTRGKHSPDKTLYEWEWNRDMADRIAKLCSAKGIKTILLVPERTDVGLMSRVRRSDALREKGKETLLVSIHINAAGGDGKWHDARGFTAWVSGNASEKSKRFATMMHEEAKKRNLLGNRSIGNPPYKTANFTIISRTKSPAVLTENLFQDNRDDVAYLKSEDGKRTIAEMHVAAIERYIESL